MKKRLSVFISYAHADKAIARKLATALREAGLRVWIDEGELRAGDSIITRVAAAIEKVEFVVALVSKNSISSKWCNKELSLAVNLGLKEGRIRVLPLRIDSVEMPPALQDTLYLELSSKNPARIAKRLVEDVRSHAVEIKKQFGKRVRASRGPLSLVSSFDSKTLRKLMADLDTSGEPEDDDLDTAEASMRALMRDYSLPAMRALYKAAVRDSSYRSWSQPGGFGLAALLYLAPVTSRWIRNLLTHENRQVASDAMSWLFEPDYVNAYALQDTFDEIRRMPHWAQFKRRVLLKMRTNSKYWRLKIVIAEAEALSNDDDLLVP